MKILFIGDLHGRMPRIHFKDFDVIVQVGDVCDDREIGKIWKEIFKNPKDISYEEYIQKFVGEKKLKQMEKRSLERGNEVLKYLDSFGKPILFVPGNWDQSYGPSRIKNMDKSDYNYMKAFFDWYLGEKTNLVLTKGIKNLVDLPFQLRELFGINFIGYGNSSGPERLRSKKVNLNENEKEKLIGALNKIINKLENVFRLRNKKKPTIFLSHNIPYRTKLDVIKNKKNAANNRHVGSIIARKMCVKYKPALCLGGHVHEGKGKDKIGKTIVVNAGYGRDAQVLIDFDVSKNKVKSVKFY